MAQNNFFKKIGDSGIPTKLSIGDSFTGSVGSSFKNSDLAWYGQEDSFFAPKKLDTERGGALYPYRLLVIDVSNNSVNVVSDAYEISVKDKTSQFVKYVSDTGGVKFVSGASAKEWEFILPITPQQLSITDQFAINTTATMRGVVEEHNGVKFKIITAAGTTGIWPTRTSLSDESSGVGNTLFGGIAESLGGVVDAFDTLKKGSKSSPNPGIDFSEGSKSATQQDTGYFQAQLLQQFIEQYAMAKKDPKNKGWRLVFDCPKTSESFIVTPITFTTTKNQRSPGESLFNMQLKAWKRIDLAGLNAKGVETGLNELSPSFFQKINSSLDNTRSLMSASSNLIKAVRADFRKPFDTLRKMTLLVKDFSGLALSVAELPNKIGQDITAATKKRSKDLEIANANFKAISAVIRGEDSKNEGLSDREVRAGVIGASAAYSSQASALNGVFDEPESNYDFFREVSVDELELTPQQRNTIQDEIELNSLISNNEIKDFIKEIKDLTLELTNNFGAGDQFFSSLYGRPDPKFRATPMSIEEFELITSIEETILLMNLMVSTRDFDDVRIQSSLEYVGGLAQDSEIPFQEDTTAKKLVPVPYNLNVQQISARYIGDADRYNEIITLNNLKSPYIDEDGFFYTLLSNGDGRQFNISTNENLFIGQKAQLSSNTQPVFIRKITGIEKITDTNYLISVDGVNNLDLLTTADQAQIKAFLPGTVNSQNQIYIPSDEPIDTESRTYDIPFLNDDTLTSMSKIDWLLEDSGDIVINSFGEAALANGTTNIVQALKMKINTAKGDILSNPDFGLGISPGIIVSDIQVETLLSELSGTILADPRFSAIEKMEITILPPDLAINIVVRLANGNGIFPINFTV